VPVGRMLRDFHMAIRAGLESDANATLGLLREQYHLDGLNLLFLRVELLASFAHWKTLLELPEFHDLLRLRKPVAVTEALLRAVYHCHLMEFENSSDPSVALQVFTSVVLPRFGALIANRSGMRSSEAAKCFMLLAANQSPHEVSVRDELLAGWELSEGDRQYLIRLSELVRTSGKPPTDDPLVRATKAVQAGDYDRALALVRALPISPNQVRLLCECAIELDTLDSRAAAVSAVEGLSEPDRNVFLQSRVNQRVWQGIQDIGAVPPQDSLDASVESLPTDWESWVTFLERHEGRRGAREIAHRGATEWSVSDLLRRADGVAVLAEKIHNVRSPAAEQTLRDSLPHLLAFFQRDEHWPNPAFRSIYRTLFERLYLSTEGAHADLIVLSDLLECLLSIGVAGASEYKELIQCVADVCHRFGAPATFDYCIDLLAIFVVHPCPSSESRLGLLDTVLESLQRYLRHVRPEQRTLVELLAADLETSGRVAEYLPLSETAAKPEFDPLNKLCSMAVAIYSLTESASRQAQQILEANYPGVKVSLSDDLAGTPRLKQLARQADLFVMVTASAKHAATAFITANRPKDMPIIRPNGKGAAGMLAAIRGYFCNFE